MGAPRRVSIDLTDWELLAISNALNEVCHGPEAISEFEFQSRFGVDRAVAQQLLERVGALLDAAAGGAQ